VNLDGDLTQPRSVLTAVVRAEVQIAATGHDGPD
jgi:hypothetical protein